MRRIMMLLTVALVMAAMLGLYALPASATHAGATAKCGSAGTFTIDAMQTPRGPGLQVPKPSSVLIFEEGGVLTVFDLTLNGQVLVDRNETGSAMNNVNEVTCTFSATNVGDFVATGILTP